MPRPNTRLHLVLLALGLAGLVWSGIAPRERFTWIMEVLPAVAGAALMVALYRRFPLTTLAYCLALVFAVTLMVGGHWTYAQVPLGFWVQDALGLQRNHYDRLGHFLQGFVPAILAREVLLRTSPLRAGKWLFALVTALCLAISAGYELFEWGYALAFGGQQAESFLGSQGDPWDAQWDMFLALCGAMIAQGTLAGLHDRQLRALTASDTGPDSPR